MKHFLHAAAASSVCIAAALISAPPANAQQARRPHAEECTTWGYIADVNYEYAVVNTCAYPIHVWFLSQSGAQTDGQVAPSGVFSTGIQMGDEAANVWIAAACRVGYHPTVPVSAENAEAITSSRYACVRD